MKTHFVLTQRRFPLKKIAILGVACLMGAYTNSATAQPPGGGGGRGGFGMGMGGMGASPVMMLNNAAVLEELKLSKEEADAIIKKYNEESVALFNKVLAEKAKPEQATRLSQIRAQQLGFAAFQDSTIVKSLKLTDDQVKEIKEIADDNRKELAELRQNAGNDFGGMFAKMGEIQKASVTKAIAVLKDDQKKTWEELKGKTFTMPMGGPGGGRQRRDQ